MLLHNKVREIEIGDVLELVATDPSTQRDVPKFCTFLGHDLLEQRVEHNRYYYYIRKAS